MSEKYWIQLTLQEELGKQNAFLIDGKDIKLQSWKDTGFEYKAQDWTSTPKIPIKSFCDFSYLFSLFMPLFSQAYTNSNSKSNLG